MANVEIRSDFAEPVCDLPYGKVTEGRKAGTCILRAYVSSRILGVYLVVMTVMFPSRHHYHH